MERVKMNQNSRITRSCSFHADICDMGEEEADPYYLVVCLLRTSLPIYLQCFRSDYSGRPVLQQRIIHQFALSRRLSSVCHQDIRNDSLRLIPRSFVLQSLSNRMSAAISEPY